MQRYLGSKQLNLEIKNLAIETAREAGIPFKKNKAEKEIHAEKGREESLKLIKQQKKLLELP